MAELPRQPHVARRAVEVAGDDVPADAPPRQVVERAHAARERIRVLVGQRAGDAEAQVLGGLRHQRHQRQRVEQRHLHATAQRRVARALVDVVNA
jgi:hypothetical protein